MSDTYHDDAEPERRGSDEHTRKIVKMTVHEIFDAVSVDLITPHGRQSFRDKMGFLDDAMSGTKALKRTFWAGISTLFGLIIYKMWPAFLLWISR